MNFKNPEDALTCDECAEVFYDEDCRKSLCPDCLNYFEELEAEGVMEYYK